MRASSPTLSRVWPISASSIPPESGKFHTSQRSRAPRRPAIRLAFVRVSPAGARQLNADLEMPHRSYSQVDLAFNARNFVASAHVTGLRTVNDPSPVFLGDFTLFDLTAQHLGSGLSIPIAESTFPYLRLHLTFEPAPGNSALLIAPSTLNSAQVPPVRGLHRRSTPASLKASAFPSAVRRRSSILAFQPTSRSSASPSTSIPPSNRTSAEPSPSPPQPGSPARKKR